jgi:hypothetical protein
MYDHIRDTYFPQITQTHKEFKNKSNFGKHPYPLDEISKSAITAARKGKPVKNKHHSKYHTFLWLFIFPLAL